MPTSSVTKSPKAHNRNIRNTDISAINPSISSPKSQPFPTSFTPLADTKNRTTLDSNFSSSPASPNC